MNKGVIVIGSMIAVAGVGFTLLKLEEVGATEMEGQHWLMLVIFLVGGYVAGRLFPQFGQMVGLP